MSMTKIAEITVGATPSLIQLTSIPQTYTDLMVTFSLRTNNNAFLGIYFNGSTSGYTSRQLMGNGTSASSFSRTDYYANDTNHPGLTTNTFGNGTLYIPNYAGNTNKSFSVDHVQEANQSDAKQTLDAGLWSNTAAITSITFDNYIGGTFVQNSTVTLYGISKVPAAGIQPKATGGDIYQNGAYTYHVFKSSGTFTPTVAIPNAEILCAAGGGGGLSGNGGGGGAGGFQVFTGQSLTATGYTIITGGGGAAGYTASNGSNSQFGALTASIGGGAAGAITGSNGGSGGASGDQSHTGGTPGTGTSGQGFAGGAGSSYIGGGYNSTGGGGGGATAAGTTAGGSGGVAGSGGAGATAYSAWAYTTSTGSNGAYAGGGGGGANNINSITPGSGGIGGGGNGGLGTGGYTSALNGSAGVVNTGSGGGGGGGQAGVGNGDGGAGGSGIVIIRYA